MPEFQIDRVVDREEWEGNYGPMVSYRVLLTDGSKADWNRKVTSPEPESGLRIEAELQDTSNGKFPPKLKVSEVLGNASGERKEEPEPISQAGGVVDKEPGVPARSGFDERQWSIVRQHSQMTAIEYLRLKLQAGQLQENLTVAYLSEVVDWFQEDALPTSANGGAGGVSEDRDVPAPPAAVPHKHLLQQIERSKVRDQDVRAWLGAKGIGGSSNITGLIAQLPSSEVPTMVAWLDAVEHVTSQMADGQ